MKNPDRFMVVDDDPINNMLCKLSIQRCFKNKNVELFTEPEVALGAIESEYNKTGAMLSTILLLDINMPLMTGWDFLNVFKDYSDVINQQFAIFILSSSVDDSDKEKANSNPLVCKFISKPLTTEVVQQIVVDAEKIQF